MSHRRTPRGIWRYDIAKYAVLLLLVALLIVLLVRRSVRLSPPESYLAATSVALLREEATASPPSILSQQEPVSTAQAGLRSQAATTPDAIEREVPSADVVTLVASPTVSGGADLDEHASLLPTLTPTPASDDAGVTTAAAPTIISGALARLIPTATDLPPVDETADAVLEQPGEEGQQVAAGSLGTPEFGPPTAPATGGVLDLVPTATDVPPGDGTTHAVVEQPDGERERGTGGLLVTPEFGPQTAPGIGRVPDLIATATGVAYEGSTPDEVTVQPTGVAEQGVSELLVFPAPSLSSTMPDTSASGAAFDLIPTATGVASVGMTPDAKPSGGEQIAADLLVTPDIDGLFATERAPLPGNAIELVPTATSVPGMLTDEDSVPPALRPVGERLISDPDIGVPVPPLPLEGGTRPVAQLIPTATTHPADASGVGQGTEPRARHPSPPRPRQLLSFSQQSSLRKGRR